jgi:hypothetical protein
LESTRPLKYLDNNWMKELRDFVINTNSKISIQRIWCPQIKRVNDKLIMEEILKLNRSNRELEIINYWRLYLKVQTLSDITNAAGDKLSYRFMSSKSATPTTTGTEKWPLQAKPKDSSFRIWKNAIQEAFNIDKQGRLRSTKLGKWIHHQDAFSCEWENYWDPPTNKLWKRITDRHNAIYECKYKNSRIRRYSLESDDIDVEIPSTALPIDVNILKNWNQVNIPKIYEFDTPNRIRQKVPNNTDINEMENNTALHTWRNQQPICSRRLLQIIDDKSNQTQPE